MDPKVYDRLWDKTYAAFDPDALRTRRRNHPIVEKWLSVDARGKDPALNPLFFRYKSSFRTAPQKRRLKIVNTLMWALKSEGFDLSADGNDIYVGYGWHRTKFVITEGTDRPERATSVAWRKPNGHLSCRIEAKLPAGIDRNWQDEPGAPLELRIPAMVASFAVWAFERKHNGQK
jgi:hypothetical protein